MVRRSRLRRAEEGRRTFSADDVDDNDDDDDDDDASASR